MLNDELLQDFLEESYDILDKIKSTLDQLDTKQNNEENLNSLYRWIHTIKGGSSIFNFKMTTNIAHELESYMGKLRDKKSIISNEDRSYISKEIHKIKMSLEIENENYSNGGIEYKDATNQTPTLNLELISNENNNEGIDICEKYQSIYFNDFVNNIAEIIDDMEKINQVFFEIKISAPSINNIHVFLEKHKISIFEEQPYNESQSILLLTYKKESIKNQLQFIVAEKLIERFQGGWIKKKETEKQLKEQKKIESLKNNEESTIIKDKKKSQEILRVPLDMVNKILDNVWEIFLIKNQISHRLKLIKKIKNLHLQAEVSELETLEVSLERCIQNIEQNTLSLRLNPVNKVFNRMEKVVEDYLSNSNKEIHFETNGAGIDLDKKILDQLNEPLIHLIRNALDHGIESPEIRVINNKNKTGKISLNAECVDNEVKIIIQDDGQGIQPEKIYQSALKKGIDVSHVKTDQDKINLIFEPGFSTAETITNVSGRGVGMDAVRNSVKSLGGSIEIVSHVGLGSQFIIKFPLSVSVTKFLIARINGFEYAISSKSIKHVEKVNVHTLKKNNQNYYYQYDHQLIPCYSLADIFPDFRNHDEIYQSDFHICVTMEHGEYFSFMVHEIISTYNLVQKKLPESMFIDSKILSASLLPDGRPIFNIQLSECIRSLKSQTDRLDSDFKKLDQKNKKDAS